MKRHEIIQLSERELEREREKAAARGAEEAIRRMEEQLLEVRRILGAMAGTVDKSMLCDIDWCFYVRVAGRSRT